MAFSPKQVMYLLTRVKRGVRPKLARRALTAVPRMGKGEEAVDLAFNKPYGALRDYSPVPFGITAIVDPKRKRVGEINWQLYDQGKHLHVSNMTGYGRWNLGIGNLRRLLNQFKGYTGGTINRISGYRISGVRGQASREADTMVPIPGKGVGLQNKPRRPLPPTTVRRPLGGPPVTAETPAGTHPTSSVPAIRRGRVSGWNPPSAEEMKRANYGARLPRRLQRRHYQQVAAEIHNWATRAPDRLGTVEHQRFAQIAADRLSATNPRFDRRRFIRAAMTGTDVRQQARIGYRRRR